MRYLIVFQLLGLFAVLSSCSDDTFTSEYYKFATDQDSVSFRANIQAVPAHVDDNIIYYCRSGLYFNRQITMKGISERSLILFALGARKTRAIWEIEPSDNQYIVEIIIPEPDPARNQLHKVLKNSVLEKFSIQSENVEQETKVYLLKRLNTVDLSFREVDDSIVKWKRNDGKIDGIGLTMGQLASIIESVSKSLPVFDETGIDGRFEIDIKWEAGNMESLIAVLNQNGLTLEESTKKLSFWKISPK